MSNSTARRCSQRQSNLQFLQNSQDNSVDQAAFSKGKKRKNDSHSVSDDLPARQAGPSEVLEEPGVTVFIIPEFSIDLPQAGPSTSQKVEKTTGPRRNKDNGKGKEAAHDTDKDWVPSVTEEMSEILDNDPAVENDKRRPRRKINNFGPKQCNKSAENNTTQSSRKSGRT
ncbi:uncharacterized protein MELLADRAFT_102624 [Melampsora larici-populina 98AG31]|uniref:Uncharacterized protein n=1 Tax=Melampsora larici-populina (strain 98AG31 / pathotype 3-4-7) TaxID=747676 RepID=F4R8V4_MELLP|nr:uncharacterized protein MELLADRAFT_102624 [Melampsora larici-populina 98AG31]EGG10875.1 hypothetical protein MELLADRAFT_102624 [Melampsora larici-populina 98AG31]